MSISNFWDKRGEFTASEAAQLILGLEPEVNVFQPKSIYQNLIRDMYKSFLDMCAHFRYCLERDLDPNGTPTWIWLYEEDEEIIGLASVEMSGHYVLLKAAKTFSEFTQCRYKALHWLESAIDEFEKQRFSRTHLADWLYWQELESAYQFEVAEEVAPENRRDQVRRLLIECGNNKSEVARRMGISWTRVDQLLGHGGLDKRKPLQFEAQDPFRLTSRAK